MCEVVRQTKVRVFQEINQYLSLFEPPTEIIRKGKANKSNGFGKLVSVQEAENSDHYAFLTCSPKRP